MDQDLNYTELRGGMTTDDSENEEFIEGGMTRFNWSKQKSCVVFSKECQTSDESNDGDSIWMSQLLRLGERKSFYLVTNNHNHQIPHFLKFKSNFQNISPILLKTLLFIILLASLNCINQSTVECYKLQGPTSSNHSSNPLKQTTGIKVLSNKSSSTNTTGSSNMRMKLSRDGKSLDRVSIQSVDNNLDDRARATDRNFDKLSLLRGPADDEQIAIRHRYLFKVNGKQLNLRPPSSDESKAQLNDRIGEYGTDYDSGFDAYSGGSESADNSNLNNKMPTNNEELDQATKPISIVEKNKPVESLNSGPVSTVPMAGTGAFAPPSSSASLMMSSVQAASSRRDEHEDAPASFPLSEIDDNEQPFNWSNNNNSSSSNNNDVGGQQPEQLLNKTISRSSSGANDMISDWPRAGTKQQLSHSIDRHSMAPQKTKNQTGWFSSALLTGRVNQEASFQQQQQQRWNSKSPMNNKPNNSTQSAAKFSPKLKPATTQSEPHNKVIPTYDLTLSPAGANQNKQAATKMALSPKVSVSAKARLIGSPTSNLLNDNNDKSKIVAEQSGKQIFSEAKGKQQRHSTGAGNLGGANSSGSWRNSRAELSFGSGSANSTTVRAFGVNNSSNANNHAIVFNGGGQTTEYKSNYTQTASSIGTIEVDPKVTAGKPDKAAAKNQRDLTASRQQNFNQPVLLVKQLKAVNSLLNKQASAADKDQQGNNLISIVRTGPISPHPAPSHFRSLLPTTLALLAQLNEAASEQRSRSSSSNHLRALLTNQQSSNHNQPANQLSTMSTTSTLSSPSFAAATDQNGDFSTTKSTLIGPAAVAAASSSVSAAPSNSANTDHMLALANHHLGVSHLNPQAPFVAASESNAYNSLASGLYGNHHHHHHYSADNNGHYPMDRPTMSPGSGPGSDGAPNGNGNHDSNSQASMTNNNVMGSNESMETNNRGGPVYSSSSDPSDYSPSNSGSGNQQASSSSDSSSSSSSLGDNSRVSISDHYSRQAGDKLSTRDNLFNPNRDINASARSNASPTSLSPSVSTSALDPFEDLGSLGGLSPSEYERDLADLDEEFNRHTYADHMHRHHRHSRPSSLSSINQLMSDSYLTFSPERYEFPRASRYNRRPSSGSLASSSLTDYTDYLNAAANIIPRATSTSSAYPKNWLSAAAAAGDSIFAGSDPDLWATSPSDYSSSSATSSLFGGPTGYTYRFATPTTTTRYHHQQARFNPFASTSHTLANPYSSVLAASASEQHLQPSAYNLLPTFGAAPSASVGSGSAQTETISFTLSPLAAAAAAAASALAAADKSRHHHHHGWHFTIPRLTSASAAGSSGPGSAAASTAHSTATIPATALQAYFAARPASAAPAGNPFALGAVPIYAIAAPAPRPPTSPLATAASAPPLIPAYFHQGAAPAAIIAYRPANTLLAAHHHPASASPLLSAASYAYPLRFPVTTIPRPTAGATFGMLPATSLRSYQQAFGKYHTGAGYYAPSDLQLAETKPTKTSNSTSQEGSNKRGNSLSAIARNLTKKMFGSASQIRAQHVAPPASMASQLSSSAAPTSLDLFSLTQHNSSSASL